MNHEEATSIAKHLVAGYVSKHGIPASKDLPKVVAQLATFHQAMVAQLIDTTKQVDVNQFWAGGQRTKPDW